PTHHLPIPIPSSSLIFDPLALPTFPIDTLGAPMGIQICSFKSILILLLFSAVPIGYLISLEISPPSTHVFHYHSSGGFLRECAKWDSSANRFIVSYFEGGLGEVCVPDDYSKGEEG
ncbi:hypothetical protein LINGRAHAP2_LOCUS24279, partial [Linum grandiflorum]